MGTNPTQKGAAQILKSNEQQTLPVVNNYTNEPNVPACVDFGLLIVCVIPWLIFHCEE